MTICNDCPRECGVDRGQRNGACGGGALPRVARAALHFWEEPCISGINGSGTVFFSGCGLRCAYCQNRNIALGNVGTTVNKERLAEIFLELQQKGAHNINLVTPSHEIRCIAEALKLAKGNGLQIPVVYNTGSYDKPEMLRLLDGLVDVWLPDMKYYSPQLSAKYSKAPDYFEVATRAIDEMYRQAGVPLFVKHKTQTSDGEDVLLMKRGVIVRHLVLPTHVSDSKKILKYLYQTYGDKIYISIMNQYTPLPNIGELYSELTRKVSEREYEQVVDYAINLGIENAFIQEGDTAKESFIPEFDGTGV